MGRCRCQWGDPLQFGRSKAYPRESHSRDSQIHVDLGVGDPEVIRGIESRMLQGCATHQETEEPGLEYGVTR